MVFTQKHASSPIQSHPGRVSTHLSPIITHHHGSSLSLLDTVRMANLLVGWLRARDGPLIAIRKVRDEIPKSGSRPGLLRVAPLENAETAVRSARPYLPEGSADSSLWIDGLTHDSGLFDRISGAGFAPAWSLSSRRPGNRSVLPLDHGGLRGWLLFPSVPTLARNKNVRVPAPARTRGSPRRSSSIVLRRSLCTTTAQRFTQASAPIAARQR